MSTALAQRPRIARRPIVLVAAAFVAAVAVVTLLNPSVWSSLGALAGGDKETLRAALQDFGPFAPLVSIGLNVLQGVFAPIPGFVVPFVNGAVFGTWGGMLITWIGGVAAASASFAISRTFGAGLAERLCRRSSAIDGINEKIERHALGAVTLGRFVPGIPFDVMSYFCGLTRIRYRVFALGTAIGSAPHAFLYAYMGDSLEIPLWVGVLVMPLIGIALAGVTSLIRRWRTPAAEPTPVAAPQPARRPGVALSQWGRAAAPACTTRRNTRITA